VLSLLPLGGLEHIHAAADQLSLTLLLGAVDVRLLQLLRMLPGRADNNLTLLDLLILTPRAPLILTQVHVAALAADSPRSLV